jgi:uncharacterized protein DUF6516
MAIEDDHTRTFFKAHDGYTYSYSTGHWVKIECQEVPTTPERPAGLKYSLVLFAPDGESLVRYDNSHAVNVKGRPNPKSYDHWHRYRNMEDLVPYKFINVETLLNDFFEAVERHLPPELQSG